MVTIIISFCSFFILFLFVGLLSSKWQKKTTVDYLLASREVNPWLTALSSVATTASGFMFIGLIGLAYLRGIYVFWVWLGIIVGQSLAWHFLFQQFRQKTESINAETIPEFLSSFKDGPSPLVRSIIAILIIVFLGTYAAAQLKAGSKALHVLFNWNYSTGAIIGVLIVGAYCFAGGIRASIWTDALQSIVMMGSMLVLCIIPICA